MQPTKYFLVITKHNTTNFWDCHWVLYSFWKAIFTNILGYYDTLLRDYSHQRTETLNSEQRAKIKGTIYQKNRMYASSEREQGEFFSLIRKKCRMRKNWREVPVNKTAEMNKWRHEKHCPEWYLLLTLKGNNLFQEPSLVSNTLDFRLNDLSRWLSFSLDSQKPCKRGYIVYTVKHIHLLLISKIHIYIYFSSFVLYHWTINILNVSYLNQKCQICHFF